MKIPYLPLPLCAIALAIPATASPWHKQNLTSHFYAEGAAVGDIDGDGSIDLVYGPAWWSGPDFDQSHRFTETPAAPFVADQGYSDHFFSYVLDVDGDRDNDILVYGFPGKEARLYINPGGNVRDDGNWTMHLVAPEVSNESPTLIDIVPGGLPEIVCTRSGTYGYYEASPDPTQTWTWKAISPEGEAGGRFEHGLGVGDVDGDGHLDIVQRMFWFENPGDGGESIWRKHRWALPPQPGGAQILVDDVDGDGDSDIITSIQAHGYGLAWFEQYEPGKFQPHGIMGKTSQENPFGVSFSQPHALALADVDGDGRNDVVTGKRHLAHQGKDPEGLGAPVVYWFRNTSRGEEIEFVPHLVDDDSGLGVEVKVVDLDGDERLDIISANKRGLAIHLQRGDILANSPERWMAPDGRPQDDYGSGLGAREAVRRMEVPPGFSVDLISAEPDVTQPIAMTFDSRGRIWVIEGHTYPQKAPQGEGRDRILVFEDTDGDGTFDSRKVFAEGINLASGIEVGFGGVYVGAAPHLLFYPDRDRDARADGEPEILLDGWGYQDTHETLNSFTWGPDGWLYGCHGVFTHSKVGVPGTADSERVRINAGVWRFHPVSKQFEVFAHGTSNPWGLDFNEVGDWFISACVIPHFYHLTRGGLYQRQAGQHFNTWAFDDIKTIADHAHYVGDIKDHAFWGANRAARPEAPADTSALGGGHAHCGLAIYQADVFPPAYRGAAFFHNLHGHRIVREHLETAGSGYMARHRPDFLLTNNHEFVGVGVMQGPDGALYFSDWVDAQTCHHRDVEIWDRANGRIYRVRYGEPRTTRLDLPSRSDTELVQRLGHSNAFIARQAQKLLQERAASGDLDREATDAALAAFEMANPEKVPHRLRAFWTRHVTGLLTGEAMMTALSDPEEHIRGWAVQLAVPNGGTIPRFEEMARTEPSLVVRRHLAAKLQQLPLDSRWTLAEHLIAHGLSQYDANIPLLCWYGIEPLFELDAQRAFGMGEKTRWPQLKDFVSRRGVVTPQGREAILTSLSRSDSPRSFARVGGELLRSLAQMPPVDPPVNWRPARERGARWEATNPEVEDVLSRLGTRFGDADFFPQWRAMARDPGRKIADRVDAVQLLTAGRDPELGTLARELLETPRMRASAIAALRRHPGEETARALVAVLGDLPLDLRNETIHLLGSRPAMARVLLGAVDERRLESFLISPVMLDQFDRFDDEQIDTLIQRNWARGGSGVDIAQLHGAIAEWKKKLNPRVMAKADASRGRQVYRVTCGTCHPMFGEGIALGPDLTGSNRADLGYILENVLAPTAVVGKAYMLNIFAMDDGSTLSGMIRKETPEHYTIAMPGGAELDVRKSEVTERTELPQSLMPAGLFDALPLDQVADLVKYLASPRQVPLPDEAAGSPQEAAGAGTGAGGRILEAETLVADYPAETGNVVAQGMRHFGNEWSGDRQLFWRGGKPGDIHTMKLDGLEPGTIDLVVYPTTARDYATVQFAINGQLREVDLYSETVSLGAPIVFRGVTISPGEPLQVDIHIRGNNDAGMEGRYFVGIDRFEVNRVAENP